MRIEHPGLVAVELRPVIRTFCALDIGGSGRNGRSKIESDCCESGKAGGDEDAPGRRPRSGDNADGVSCGGCDVGLT
jgi:hypothetical protein